MRLRILLITAAAMLCLLGAGTVLFLQVRVHESGIGASCGAPFDVVSGRADWQTWYADDLNDPRLTVEKPLVRTDACPAAVNRRTVGAAALGAVALIAGAAAIGMRTRGRAARMRPMPLRRLGAWVAAIGAALTTAGIAALVLLLADPGAALFLYVERWVVAVIGLIVLIPAIALAAFGRALMIVAATREGPAST